MRETNTGGLERWHGVLKAYRGPKLRVWEIQVEGPHVEQWPPAGHDTLYGDLMPGDLNPETINERLSAFARSAFRRPPTEGELKPIRALVAAKLDAGLKPLDALQLGFQTILCAPGFLYQQEGEGQLNGYALASRLSYFLWSSMPDDELLKLAAAGTLSEPATRRKQVERMLADPKGQRFVSNFTRIWLELDNIGKMPPSKDFLTYYRDNLESAMRKETEHFFGHILRGEPAAPRVSRGRLQFPQPRAGGALRNARAQGESLPQGQPAECVARRNPGARQLPDGLGQWRGHLAGGAGNLRDEQTPRLYPAATARRRAGY